MATEQGAKAVDAGVRQSAKAGQSIESPTISVEKASHAASVIEVSNQQQSTGIDQVASAMRNIEQAITHNIAGTRQLEEAAARLASLGIELERVVELYKV